jgi:hypothetical protein
MCRMSLRLAFLIWLGAAAAVAAPADGPYVVRDADGALVSWSVDAADGKADKAGPLAPGDEIAIAAVESLPAFRVTLRAPAKAAADAIEVPAKSPVFVVADTHGEFAILAPMLQKHRVIDAQLRWSFGRGHLVVLGDVFDRGPNHTEILWLLYQLEAEAAKAGGGVHLLLGNHETMVLMGDVRYLNPKYVDTARVLGVNYYELFDARSVLGQWLRSRPAILRINRQLFLHAGISRTLVERQLSLPHINSTIRKTLEGSLSEPERDVARLLMTADGPLWYRGFFAEHRDFTTATSEDVGAALKQFDVDRILIGHTIVPTIVSLFDGRVIALNVYPKREGESVSFEALLLRGGKTLRARADGGVAPL